MSKLRRMHVSQPIAQQLRHAIRNSGMSGNAIAKAADVSQAVLSKFMAEDSTKTLNIETAQAIAKAIGHDLQVVKIKK